MDLRALLLLEFLFSSKQLPVTYPKLQDTFCLFKVCTRT
jgi:hypothetical protein